MTHARFTLEVWGDLACFSNPAMGKVERFSYPFITPSAARGIFDAICVNRHEYGWQITKIELLAPPRYIALRRNEVKNRAPSERTIGQWMDGKAPPEPIWADGTEEAAGRTQRQTMALKDVRYRLHATMRPWPGFEHNLVGMASRFERIARAGKCWYQPFFGCREFPCYFELADPSNSRKPEDIDIDAGWMLYDVFDLSRPGESLKEDDSPFISLFRAEARSGVVEVPPFESDAVRKPERRVAT
jgi:CRISPR-associated protein Cas5d